MRTVDEILKNSTFNWYLRTSSALVAMSLNFFLLFTPFQFIFLATLSENMCAKKFHYHISISKRKIIARKIERKGRGGEVSERIKGGNWHAMYAWSIPCASSLWHLQGAWASPRNSQPHPVNPKEKRCHQASLMLLQMQHCLILTSVDSPWYLVGWFDVSYFPEVWACGGRQLQKEQIKIYTGHDKDTNNNTP